MLKDDAIYNSSFRFRNINLDNINDIYLVINIIVVITTTLLEIFIAVIFIFKLDIIIIFNVNNIAVIVIIIFKKSIFKLIAFDLDMKNCLIMNASLDKS